jgi:Glycosyl hydrolases family 2, sugar binding domain/Glycosyl hydrolases family 2
MLMRKVRGGESMVELNCRIGRIVVLMFCAALSGCMSNDLMRPPVSLAGKWRFALDRDSKGIQEEWFKHRLKDEIALPGSLQEQGFGDFASAQTQWVSGIGSKLLNRPKYAEYQESDEFRTPFWLTPTRHYVGVAWYQRKISIPESWKGKDVALHLERPHGRIDVWLDGRWVPGWGMSLGTAEDFYLGRGGWSIWRNNNVPAGRHMLTIREDNSWHPSLVGRDASSVTDQTQTDWNGLIGDISLRAEKRLHLRNVQIYPDLQAKCIHVVATILDSTSPNIGEGQLTASVEDRTSHTFLPDKTLRSGWGDGNNTVSFDYPMGPDIRTWDEFSPALYSLHLRLRNGGSTSETQATFGMRELSTRGAQFILNGRPIMLRGTLECCIFPLTGYPPTDLASWKRIFTICRDHGLNHVRFHSWCPPEAAFDAADEMGMYLSVECSCWAHFTRNELLDRWVDYEAERMMQTYGNHPSFMFIVPSNEPGGDDGPFLQELISKWEKEDSRRLYTAGSGWPRTPANQYEVEQDTRLHQSGELTRPPQTISDYRDYIKQHHDPCVVHEMGQWCVYPNFDEIKNYTGSLRPGNLEIFQDMLNKSGMGNQSHAFLMASGKFQTQLYKAEIEEVLRTPHMGGFQLLDLHDFPGQGTAPVGVLDAFWDEKPYVTAEQYRRFCNQTVPLARFAQRTFTSDQTAHVEIDISHFGPADLKDAKVAWRVCEADGKVVRHGELPARTIDTGKLSQIGTIELAMSEFPAPAKMNLEVSIAGTPFVNDWDFWVYPTDTNVHVPTGVSVVRAFDNATIKKLNRGERVLFLLDPSRVAGHTHGDFAPIFWNRITFPTQINHTLGILCDPKSPALAAFPNEGYTNWQWWDLLQHSKPMILDHWPGGTKPIVQMIDDWDECRKLGLIVEARVGSGKLMICSIDLQNDLQHRPAARQMVRSLLAYMRSNAFAPQVNLTVDQVRSVMR